MAAKPSKIIRRQHNPAHDPGGGKSQQERGQNAFDALAVKSEERKFFHLAFAQDNARNQIAGNDEKDIDAGEAARRRETGVESEHGQNGQRAQPVDVGTKFMMRRQLRLSGRGSVIKNFSFHSLLQRPERHDPSAQS